MPTSNGPSAGHARQDLEDKLDRLVHRARERLAVPARARHALGEYARTPLVWLVAGTVVTCLVAAVVLWRARR